MAETQHSVRLIKEFSYRGAPRKFSNRYYFDGGAPDDWDELINAFVALEAPIYRDFVEIIAGQGFAPGSEVAVANLSLSQPGTLSAAGQTGTPGDCAVLLRQATTKISIKNHVVYVFSYYHGAMIPTGSMPADQVHSAQQIAVEDLGDILNSGYSVGGRVYHRTTPDGHPVVGAFTSPWVHHRDFLN